MISQLHTSTNISIIETGKAFLAILASSSTSLIHRPYCTLLLVTNSSLSEHLTNMDTSLCWKHTELQTCTWPVNTQILPTRAPVWGGTLQNTWHVHGPRPHDIQAYQQELQSGVVVHYRTWFWSRAKEYDVACDGPQAYYGDQTWIEPYQYHNLTWPAVDSKV